MYPKLNPNSAKTQPQTDKKFQILYGSEKGFHAIDIENEIKYDLYIPSFISPPIIPHQILILPESDGMELLLCYNDEGVYVNTFGTVTKVTYPRRTTDVLVREALI